jgi:hypothetical protein
MQTRVTVYGNLIATSDLPNMISNIMSPGRLTGNNFVVASSDYMDISPGSCLLPNGILIIEDEVKSLVIPNSSLATDYTVIYQLQDTTTLGGSPAILQLLSGIKNQADYTDGTILGWIRYPGGSIPISQSFFIQPSHLKISKSITDFYYKNNCPFNMIRSTSVTGWTEATAYQNSEACTRFVNTNVAASVYTLKFPFIIPNTQPVKLVTRLLVDFNCLVTFSINMQGTVVTLSPDLNNGLISNTGTIITRDFDIPYSADVTWKSGTTAYIQADIDAQSNRGVSLAYVGLTLEPTPFTLFT